MVFLQCEFFNAASGHISGPIFPSSFNILYTVDKPKPYCFAMSSDLNPGFLEAITMSSLALFESLVLLLGVAIFALISCNHSREQTNLPLNFLSHCQQVKCFSPVWILSCSFKLPRSANFLSHVSNWMVLLQCEFFHVPSSHLESFKRTDKRAHEGGNGCCCCCQKMVLG